MNRAFNKSTNNKSIMEREKLLHEYEVTLDSLIEKNKFVYSEQFYALDEFEKQKYTKDKMATESHLNSLCDLLWGAKLDGQNGLGNLFALSLLSYMFGGCGGFGSTSNTDAFKKELDKIPVAEETQK